MCICVYNLQKSNNLRDFIYTFKANLKMPNFKLGQKEFWTKDMSYRKDTEKGSGKGIKVKDSDIQNAFKEKKK
jgi:hypothetical protein